MSTESKGDLISREALRNEIDSWGCNDFDKYDFLEAIDNAPTITDHSRELVQKSIEIGRRVGYFEGKIENKRPQGEREFIEIFAQNVPEDLCTYPEYKGKPYYSIHYKENGEDFVGFGTYNPEVLSRYLRDYFMRGGEDNDEVN